MKKLTLTTAFLIAIISFCTLQTKAQELDTFENFKKQEKAKFQQFKKEYKRQFEIFKKNEQDWNKEILGIDVETPISERVKEKDKDLIAKPLMPKYVNLNASLDNEIKQIKLKVNKIVKQDFLPKQKNKSPQLEVKKELVEAQKMANPINTSKVKIKSPWEEVPMTNASVKTTVTSLDTHKASLIEVEKRSIPSSKPILAKYRLSSKFGNRFHPTLFRWRFHGGVDMACPKGTEIHIPADGVVVKSGWNGGYGNYIKVKHGNGYETVYGHLSRVSVKKGEKVKKGDVIGKVGSTGRSTGSHLHYEILKNKKRVNPERFFG